MDSTSTLTLNRLLAHLDTSLLSSDADTHQLRYSHYERNKVGANVEHARTLLLTLEKQASTIRIQSQRQQIQADLQRKRDLIKRLNARLQELEQLGDENEDDEDSDDDEDEDIMASYAPARNDTDAGLDTGGDANGIRISNPEANELRSRRKPLQASDNLQQASTTAREQLFAGQNRKQDPLLSQSETLLSHNRLEQESLTTGLLGLARALKESSLQFSSSLETEKDTLKRAEGGLEKSALGMEAAERKMGMLRRMSEGQGWWGRIKLYGFIFALWVACFLLVFIGPKLRF